MSKILDSIADAENLSVCADSHARYVMQRATAARAEHAEIVEALDRQCDNIAFILNHHQLPDQWNEKFTRELEKDRALLTRITKDGKP